MYRKIVLSCKAFSFVSRWNDSAVIGRFFLPPNSTQHVLYVLYNFLIVQWAKFDADQLDTGDTRLDYIGSWPSDSWKGEGAKFLVLKITTHQRLCRLGESRSTQPRLSLIISSRFSQRRRFTVFVDSCHSKLHYLSQVRQGESSASSLLLLIKSHVGAPWIEALPFISPNETV